MMQDDEPSDDDAFRIALSRLVQAAHENGVDVRGGWECHTGPGPPEWDAMITEVAESADEPSADSDE